MYKMSNFIPVKRYICMTRLLLTLIIAMCAVSVDAATDAPLSDNSIELASVRPRYIRERYPFVTEQGDTALMVVLNNVTVFPPLKFKNKKQEQFYWRTVRDVKRTLPYAKLIAETLVETYEYIETFPTKAEREAHLKAMEKDIFEQYKPVMKTFTKSQGKMLIKLIDRETNQSGYDIIKAFLGSFRAGFWQTFGRFFGVNLKAHFRPDKNSDDAIVERVCTLVEEGQL